MQEGEGIFGFFLENPEDQEREGILDVGIQSRRNGQSIRRSDVRRTRQREAGIRCRVKEERGERKESCSRNSRAQDTGGDYSATEMPGTGHRGRLFGNGDAEHRTLRGRIKYRC